MTSAAAAASGTTSAASGGPGNRNAYEPWISFQDWRKHKDNIAAGKGSRAEWELWNTHMSQRNMNAPVVYRKPEVAEEIVEENEVGSTPGFEKVQRFLRQQRATGRVVSPQETRAAWQGYWDAWSDKQAEREELGLAQERLDLEQERWEWQKEFAEEELDSKESAAKASGGTMIGSAIGFGIGGPVGGGIGGAIGGLIGGGK